MVQGVNEYAFFGFVGFSLVGRLLFAEKQKSHGTI